MDGDALVEAFSDNSFKFANPELATDVAAAATANGFSDPADVSDEYEAFMFQRPKVVDIVSQELVDAFRIYLTKNRKPVGKENATKPGQYTMSDWESLTSVITPTKTPGRPSKRKTSAEGAGLHKTPAGTLRPIPASPGTAMKTPASVTASLLAPTPHSSFKGRSQSGAILKQLNKDLPAVSMGSEASGLEVKALGDVLLSDARYMADTMRNKALYIEERILHFIAAVQKAGGPVATYPVASPSQDTVFAAGRVVCDSEGHLNTKSVLLEGSMQHSGGQRVHLDLSKVVSYSIVPGQIVIVEGTNPTGTCFMVSNIISHIPHGREDTELAEHSAVIACGPFTTSEDLAFEPLQELLEYCSKHKPSQLVLIGPFVDAEHPEIASGLLDITFDDLFATQVRQHVEGYLQAGGSGTSVVLIPSLRCVQHHPVFPQPPFEADGFDPPGSVSCLPNPSMWSFGGLAYGATAVDSLKHLSSADLRRGAAADRMAQLGSYLLDQGSFYPLYPPGPGVNLDSSLAVAHLQMPRLPQLLLTPSDLAPAAKIVDIKGAVQGQPSSDATVASPEPASQAVLVNPGRLAKGASGGTFAHIHVQGSDAGALQAPSIADSIRVDIVKV